MNRRFLSPAILGLVFVSCVPAFAAGCADKEPTGPGAVAPTSTPTTAPPPGPGPTAAPGPGGPGPTTTAPPIPQILPTATPSGGGTAQPLDPNAAGAATAALGVLASTEAPGMAKDGPTVAGNFQDGQTLEGAFTFQPGKCYTLVAAGVGPREIELEMQYTTPLPGFSPSIATSKGTAQAAIGAKGSCLKPISPMAAPAKFILRAKGGGGLAAAQLFSK